MKVYVIKEGWCMGDFDGCSVTIHETDLELREFVIQYLTEEFEYLNSPEDVAEYLRDGGNLDRAGKSSIAYNGGEEETTYFVPV